MAQLEAAERLGWHLTEEVDLQSLGSRLDQNALVKAFADIDIKDIGASVLDTVTAKGKSLKIEGPLVLQIQKIRNVTAPKINESSNAHPKLLKLTLTDGHTTINCLDLSKNPILSLDTPPGTKVLIKGAVSVEQRFWILTDKSIEFLGGKVDHLIEKWEISKTSGIHFSRVRKTGADGPPPWIPFGQKLKSSHQPIDGNFKALGVQQTNALENDGPDEFEQARQQTISDLKSQTGQVVTKKFESVKIPKTFDNPAATDTAPQRKPKSISKQETARKYCRDIDYDTGYDDDGSESCKPAAPTTLMDFLDSKVLQDQPKSFPKAKCEPDAPPYNRYEQRPNGRETNYQGRGRGRGQSGTDRRGSRGRGGPGRNFDRPQRDYPDRSDNNYPPQRSFYSCEADFPQVSSQPQPVRVKPSSNDVRSDDLAERFGSMKLSSDKKTNENRPQGQLQSARPERPKASQWKKGDICLAQYFGDGRFYDATIIAVDDKNNICDVLFENFANVEQVAIRNILTHPRYKMTLLENEQFLVDLGRLFQKAKASSSISITMKRYDGRTKPKPRNVDELPPPPEYNCLFRASVGPKKISTVVHPKDVNKFQLAYASMLKLHMDSLKKRDKKADKDKEKKSTRPS